MEAIKLHLTELMIEVTRKCNMKCEHCLRGDAQKVNIDHSYITALLENVSCIGSLTFTGGEPSLNVPAIRFTLDELKRLNISVDNFYIVTNGRKTSMNTDFAMVCLDLYHYQQWDTEEMGSMLQISKDDFHTHTEEQRKSIKYLSAFSFFSVRDNGNYSNGKALISEGKAEENGIGYRYLNVSKWGFEVSSENNIIIEGNFYLNCLGGVTTNCDMSYETQSYNTIIDMNEPFIPQLIEQLTEEIIEELGCILVPEMA